MKIVFVSQPLSAGGAERVVAALANKFYELGHEVKIVVVDNGDSNTYYTNPKIEIIHISKPQNPIIDLLYRAKEMRKYFKNYRPDVIIPFTTQKNVSVLLATLFSSETVIACERNNPANDPSNKALRLLRRLLFWTAKGYVFQTEEAKSYFSKGIQKRSCVIPNPINDSLITPVEGDKTNRIVMVCRLNSQKNIDMAIDSMKYIKESYPEYILEIYGKSYPGSHDYEDRLKKRVTNENLEKNVHFMGFRSDVHERIKDASIFLITSNHEGMSNSLMEAMALGLACISTDDSNGGARALISDHENGILIPVGDTRKCINAIGELISDKELAKKISKNAIRIREELSIERISCMWIDYIKTMI